MTIYVGGQSLDQFGGTSNDQLLMNEQTRFNAIFNSDVALSADMIMSLTKADEALNVTVQDLLDTKNYVQNGSLISKLEKESKQKQNGYWSSLSEPRQQVLKEMGYKPPSETESTWYGTLFHNATHNPVTNAISEIYNKGAKFTPVGLPFYLGGKIMGGMGWVAGEINHAYRAWNSARTEGDDRYFTQASLAAAKTKQSFKAQGIELSEQDLEALKAKYVEENGLPDQVNAALSTTGNGLGTSGPSVAEQLFPGIAEKKQPFDRSNLDSVKDSQYQVYKDYMDQLGKDEYFKHDFVSNWNRTSNGEEYIDASDVLQQWQKLSDAGFSPDIFNFALYLGKGHTVAEWITDVEKIDPQQDQENYSERRRVLSSYLVDKDFKKATKELGAKYNRVSLGRSFAKGFGLPEDTAAFDIVSGTGDFVAQVVLDPTLMAGRFAKLGKVAYKGVAALDMERVASVMKAVKIGETSGQTATEIVEDAGKILRAAQAEVPVNAVADAAREVHLSQTMVKGSLKSQSPLFASVRDRVTDELNTTVDDLFNVFNLNDQGLLTIDANFLNRSAESATDLSEQTFSVLSDMRDIARNYALGNTDLLPNGITTINSAMQDSMGLLVSDIDNMMNQMRRVNWNIFDIRKSKFTDRLMVARVKNYNRWADRIVTAFTELDQNPDNYVDTINRLVNDLPGGHAVVGNLEQAHQAAKAVDGLGFVDFNNVVDYMKSQFLEFGAGLGTKPATRSFGKAVIGDKFRLWGSGDVSAIYRPNHLVDAFAGGIRGAAAGRAGSYVNLPEITKAGKFTRNFTNKFQGLFEAVDAFKGKNLATRVATKPVRMVASQIWNLTHHAPTKQVLSVLGDDFVEEARKMFNWGKFAGMTPAQRDTYFANFILGKVDEGTTYTRYLGSVDDMSTLRDDLAKFVEYARTSGAADVVSSTAEVEKSAKFLDQIVERMQHELIQFRTTSVMNDPVLSADIKRAVNNIDNVMHDSSKRIVDFFDENFNTFSVNGNVAEARYYIVDEFMRTLFDDLGLTDEYLKGLGNKSGKESLLNRLKKRIYAPDGADAIKMGDEVRNFPVLPVAQYSTQIAIPDTRALFQHMQNLNRLQRFNRFALNNTFIDTVMGKYWKPLTLLRLGFVPRAAGEELFAFFAREGFNVVPALGARYALRDKRGVLSGIVNYLGHRPLNYWSQVAKSGLENEVWEMGYALQFSKYKEYLNDVAQKVLVHSGKELSNVDHFQIAASWLTAQATRTLRSPMISLLPDSMKRAVVITAAGTPKLDVLRAIDNRSLNEILAQSNNALARHAWYQHQLADDFLNIGNGIPESFGQDVVTKELEMQTGVAGKVQKVKVRVGREFEELDQLTDGDLGRLGFWYAQIANDPIAVQYALSALRGAVSEDELINILQKRMADHFGSFDFPSIEDFIPSLSRDPRTGALIHVDDMTRRTLVDPFDQMFFDSSSLDTRGYDVKWSSDSTYKRRNNTSSVDFVDGIVDEVDQALQIGKKYQRSIRAIVDDPTKYFSLNIDPDGNLINISDRFSVGNDRTFYELMTEKDLVADYERIFQDLVNTQIANGIPLNVTPERITELAREQVRKPITNWLNKSNIYLDASIAPDSVVRQLDDVRNLYLNGYISKDELSQFADSYLDMYLTKQNNDIKEIWDDFHRQVTGEGLNQPDLNFARQKLSQLLRHGGFDWSKDSELERLLLNLPEDQLKAITFEDLNYAVRQSVDPQNTSVPMVQGYVDALKNGTDNEWVDITNEAAQRAAGPRQNVPGVFYEFDEVPGITGNGEYTPQFFKGGEFYRGVRSDGQWYINENGDLVMHANVWGRNRSGSISATESMEFARDWGPGADKTQRRLIIMDAQSDAFKSSRGAGWHKGEIEISGNNLNGEILIPAGQFKIINIPPSWEADLTQGQGARNAVGATRADTATTRSIPVTRQVIAAELRMVAAGAPIESTRYLRHLPLNQSAYFNLGEVDDATFQLLQTQFPSLRYVGTGKPNEFTHTMDYGDALNVIKSRGFADVPAPHTATRAAHAQAQVDMLLERANQISASTQKVFTKREVELLSEALTSRDRFAFPIDHYNFDELLTAAGINKSELTPRLQEIVNGSVNEHKNLSVLLKQALRDVETKNNRTRLQYLNFYTSFENDRYALSILDKTPLHLSSRAQARQAMIEELHRGFSDPRFARQVNSQRRAYVTSTGRFAPRAVKDGEAEIFTVMGTNDLIASLESMANNVRHTEFMNWFADDMYFKSGLSPKQQESLYNLKRIHQAILQDTPDLTNYDKVLLERFFNGIDTDLLHRGLEMSGYANGRSMFPISTVGFTSKDDAERVAELIGNWRPTPGQMNRDLADIFEAQGPVVGSAIDTIGQPVDRNSVAFIRMPDNPTMVTVTRDDVFHKMTVHDQLDKTPIEDWSETLADILLDSFTDDSGRVMHELVSPISDGKFDSRVMTGIKRKDLPAKLYAPKEYVVDETTLDKISSKGFDFLNQGVASLARMPMYTFYFSSAYDGARLSLAHLRTPGLDDEILRVLKNFNGNVDIEDLRGVWNMIPHDMQREIGNHAEFLRAMDYLEVTGKVNPASDVVRLIGSSPDKSDTLIRWLRMDGALEDKAVLLASRRAVAEMVPFLDNHQVRSFFQDKTRNVFPFLFAQEQFLKRWIRSAMYDPVAIRRASLLSHAITTSMFTHEDVNGNKSFVIPGSDWVNDVLASTPIPFLKDQFNVPGAGGLDAALGIRYDRMLPGIPKDFETLPAFSPYAMIGVDAITRMFPELKPAFEPFTAGYPIDNSESIGAQIFENWVPANYRRLVGAIFQNGLQQSEVAGATIGAMMQAEAEAERLRAEKVQLVEAGKLDEAIDLDRRIQTLSPSANATEEDVAAHTLLVKNWAYRNMFVRATIGWATGSTPQNVFTNSELQNEFSDLLQHFDFDEALSIFYAEHPYDGAYTIYKTKKSTKAPLPRTKEAVDWLVSNKEWLTAYSKAGPWLIPQASTYDDSDAQAWSEYLASDLIEYKDAETWFSDLIYARGANEYFPLKSKYDIRIAQASTNSEKKALKSEWEIAAERIKLENPVFAKRLASSISNDATETLNQMELILNIDEGSRPKIAQFDELKFLTGLYRTYQNEYDALGGSNTNAAKAKRIELKRMFLETGSGYLVSHPEMRSYWNSVLLPATNLTSEWQLKKQLGD